MKVQMEPNRRRGIPTAIGGHGWPEIKGLRWVRWGIGFGLFGMLIAAFAGHGAQRVSVHPNAVELFQTGLRYHFIHALALIGFGVALKTFDLREVPAIGWFFVAGIFLFPGGIYLFALTANPAFGWFAAAGGLAFILAWGVWNFTWIVGGLRKE